MSTFALIAAKIIKEQESVIGPLAWFEAQKVSGLKVINQEKGEVSIIEPDEKQVVNKLVNQYVKIFGLASHQVCLAAVAHILANLSPDQIPESLT